MLVAIVQVHVKTDSIEPFKIATLENATNSIKEPGVARFDVYQQSDDPTRFTLVEIYRTDDAPNKHRETAHYRRWRDSVTTMMAEPRTRLTYSIFYPPAFE
jgi:autoinducer 2-degrading protein